MSHQGTINCDEARADLNKERWEEALEQSEEAREDEHDRHEHHYEEWQDTYWNNTPPTWEH